MTFDKEKFLEETKCDVCKRTGIAGVASSCLGPISLAFCGECLTQRAEPDWLLHFTWDSCSGQVADWVKFISTYVNGRYLIWDDWVRFMEANPECYPPLEYPEPDDFESVEFPEFEDATST